DGDVAGAGERLLEGDRLTADAVEERVARGRDVAGLRPGCVRAEDDVIVEVLHAAGLDEAAGDDGLAAAVGDEVAGDVDQAAEGGGAGGGAGVDLGAAGAGEA